MTQIHSKHIIGSIAERFWPKVSIGPQNDCWEWQASRFQAGYGRFRIDGVTCFAHRVLWELLTNTKLRRDQVVCHKCDNPPCCNPAHLFLGTHKDNTQDALSKGRIPLGEKAGSSKLTDEEVHEIRWLLGFGVSQHLLGREYQTDQANISAIKRRKTWRHI